MEYEHPGIIKYTLEKVGSVENRFTILWQHEVTRHGRGASNHELPRTSSNLFVSTSQVPQITKGGIWTRGMNRTNDLVPSHLGYTTEAERDAAYDMIVHSLALWAALPKWDSIRERVKPEFEQLSLWD